MGQQTIPSLSIHQLTQMITIPNSLTMDLSSQVWLSFSSNWEPEELQPTIDPPLSGVSTSPLWDLSHDGT